MNQKTDFLVIFDKFSITLSYALRGTPQFFFKRKTLSRYIILVSFIDIASAVAKLEVWKSTVFENFFKTYNFS